jgi:hypothetical protein
MELGRGEPDEYGRRMLSPQEVALAIAYAFGDSPPADNPILHGALRNDLLRDKKNIEDVVRKMIAKGAPPLRKSLPAAFYARIVQSLTCTLRDGQSSFTLEEAGLSCYDLAMRCRAQFLLALFCFCVVRAAFAQPYIAVFSDGKRITGEKIAGWHARDTKPTLDGMPIIDGDRQLRWFQNRSLAVVKQQITDDGFVEFVGDDRLPGRVIGCSADSNADNRQLIVDTRHSWSIPNGSARTHERVFVKFVQRICWRNRGERELSPGTLFLSDGSQQRIRSLRWLSGGIQVLTADGQRSLRFDELAEIHLPVRDSHQVVMSERKSSNVSPVLRIATAEGLLATGSQSTFDAITHSSDADRENLVNKISRIKQRRAFATARNEQAKHTHEKLLATFERNVKDAETRFANTLQRMEQKIDKWSPAEREAWIDRVRNSLVERPKENVKLATERHKELRANSEKRIAELMKATDVEIERLDKELDATDPTGNTANWYHKIHPTWSVNSLWVRFSHVRIRQSFAANEIPLTRLRPIRVVQRSTLGQGFTWRSGYSVVGGPLRSTGREYGWGIGVHAENELHFELPHSVKSFRTLVALDASSGDGGCARASIHLNDVTSMPIYRSPILIGSRQVFDTGELELSDERDKQSGTNARKLILVVHQQHDNRPANSDPFDIRDHVNWLEPIITLESN